MALTLSQIMKMDLLALTEKNHSLASLFIAIMDDTMEAAKRKGVSPARIKYSTPRKRPDGRFAIDVNY